MTIGAWHNRIDYKMEYLLFFARDIVPKYRPDIQGPMRAADGESGSSFFAIAENKAGGGYEEMGKRIAIPHHLLCGIDEMCRFLPIAIGRWFPVDCLAAIKVSATVPSNAAILQFISDVVNFPMDQVYQYSETVGQLTVDIHCERFGLGRGLRYISQSIGSPHAVADALLRSLVRL